MVDNITSGNTTLFSGKSQTLKQSNDNDGSRRKSTDLEFLVVWNGHTRNVEWLNRIMGPQPPSDGV